MKDYTVVYDIPSVLCTLFFIAYLLWGIYMLKQRLMKRVELDVRTEAITLAALAVFFIIEIALLRAWLADRPVQLIMAALGLFASGVALYGPMVVSFSSQMLTEMLMPRGYWAVDEPQYGGAEGKEEQSDFEGAAREYIVLAKMFPKVAKPALRAADNLMKVGKPREAAEWFEQGFRRSNRPDECLPVVNRLHGIYMRQLNDPGKARTVLESYLERFPDTEYAESVKKRLRQSVDDKAPESEAAPPEEFEIPEPEPEDEQPEGLPQEETKMMELELDLELETDDEE